MGNQPLGGRRGVGEEMRRNVVAMSVADNRARSRLPRIEPELLVRQIDAAIPENWIDGQLAVTRWRPRSARTARREARNRCRTVARGARRKRWPAHRLGRSPSPRPRPSLQATPAQPAPEPVPWRPPLRVRSARWRQGVVSLVVVLLRRRSLPHRAAGIAGSASGALAATVEHWSSEVK